MKQSLTYYLVKLVLKLKGIKKLFSQGPINYQKLRKEDVHKPKGRFYKKNRVKTWKIQESVITEVKTDSHTDKLVLFIHGGAFISGPAQHHWDAIKKIVKQTNACVWLCNYPKAPESDIKNISKNIDFVYEEALKKFASDNITLLGDSVGGTLICTLTQRLVKHKKALPKQLILISPVMDASMSNPDIDNIDKQDPMLSKKGIVSAKKLCAGSMDLKNPMISPLYGDFKGFPPTIIFVGQYDIMYPDELLAIQKMKEANLKIKVIQGDKMPHIWPLLPVMKEAKEAFNSIIVSLKG